MRFQTKTNSGLDIHFNESAPDRGITVAPVGDFVSRGPKGLVAVKSGYATLASRDASGSPRRPPRFVTFALWIFGPLTHRFTVLFEKY